MILNCIRHWSASSPLLLKTSTLQYVSLQQMGLFEWLRKIFNKVDEDRRKLIGPDRSCAEWLLRNGAGVRFRGQSNTLRDYNQLPKFDEDKAPPIWHIVEIDATDSGISYEGFYHMHDCKYISKINLNQCQTIDDKALQLLHLVKDSLQHLQVSGCANVTDKGLLHLTVLSNLKTLIVYNLPEVRKKEDCKNILANALKNCDVDFRL